MLPLALANMIEATADPAGAAEQARRRISDSARKAVTMFRRSYNKPGEASSETGCPGVTPLLTIREGEDYCLGNLGIRVTTLCLSRLAPESELM
jgi:hypothetical protein